MENSTIWVNILRGVVIGIANIIPGVSGGTMMVSMGIYDQLIHAVTHLFSDFKKSFQFLLPIGIGIVLALAILAKLFDYLLLNWPIPTNMAFCGLIAGSLPPIFKQVQGKRITISMALAAIVFFGIVVGSALFGESHGTQDVVLSSSFFGLLMLFLVGIISAATMVIPGVSGSMILMLLGYYEPVINLVSETIDALLHFDFEALWHCIVLALPFGLGVIIGVFAIAKLIEWVLEHYEAQTYWAIIGLIVASPIAILINTNWTNFSFGQLFVGCIACMIGAYTALKLADL